MRWKKKRQLRLDEQIAMIPLRNEGVTLRDDEDGAKIIEVRMAYTGALRLASRVLKMRPFRRFRLDGLGLCVYESIDGRRTFEELIDAFAAEHKLTFFESRALLMQYMRTLMERGLVVVAMPKTAAAKPR